MPFYFTPYIILPLLSAIINAMLAGIALRERKIPAANPLFWVTFSLCIWSLASAIDTSSTILGVKIICRKITATTACITVPALFALALEVSGLKNRISRLLIALVSIIPLISTLLFWTSSAHKLQLYNYHLLEAGPLHLLTYSEGPFFTLGHYGYIVAMNVISIGILASGYWRFPKSEWQRLTCLIIAVLIPLVIAVFKITPLTGFSFISSGFFISGAFYFIAIFRHWLIYLLPIAKDTLIEIMADPVIVVNQSGQLALANQAARELFMLPAKLTGLSISALERRFPQITADLAYPSSQGDDQIFSEAPGQRSWQLMRTPINDNGVNWGWLITFKDVTSLQQTNSALQNSNDLLTVFSLAVEQSPISIVITDLEGTIEFINPKFTEVTGYTREEAIGQNPRIFKTEKTPPELHKNLWKTIKSGCVWEGEFTNKKKNGDIFIEHAKISPIVNKDGQISKFLAFKEDITVRKKVDEELQRLNLSLLGRIDEETSHRMKHERLIANQSRLVAMGEMIGAIAHQWRQPLATLAMIIQRMHVVGCRQRLTCEELGEFKDNAMRQVKYMSETIEEFSGFYNKDKRSEKYSPIKCIKDAVKLFEPQFNTNNIIVTLHTNDNLDLLVPGFPNEFKQVMLNLLGNARDAILESRIIRSNHDQGRIDINIFINEEKKLIVDITDSGCGIPDNIVNRIFDPYFTTKEKTGGTGIGLYMSRMIMLESLGGFLQLIKADNGAVFRVKLPLGDLS